MGSAASTIEDWLSSRCYKTGTADALERIRRPTQPLSKNHGHWLLANILLGPTELQGSHKMRNAGPACCYRNSSLHQATATRQGTRRLLSHEDHLPGLTDCKRPRRSPSSMHVLSKGRQLSAAAIALGFASSPTFLDLVTVGGLLTGLLIIGVIAFFLPLRRLHHRMVQQKGFERARLSERLAAVLEPSDAREIDYQEVLEVLKLDLMDRKVSTIATWPFDFQILGKLTIILLSVTAALLTRFVAFFLRL